MTTFGRQDQVGISLLYPSEDGFAVCVPSLPGCWSQGETEQEALETIESAEGAQVREIEVAV